MSSESAFKTFDQMYTEAENNHSTQRYVDSAKIFNHLANKSVQAKMYEDTIYMVYREIVEYHLGEKHKQKVQAIARLGEFCLMLAANQGSSLQQETDDNTEKIEMMRVAEKCYRMLGKTEELESILYTFININTGAVRSSENLVEKINLHKEQIRLKKELGMEFTVHLQEIVNLYFKQGDKMKREDQFNPNETAASYYIEAIPFLDQLMEIKPEMKYKDLRDKAMQRGNEYLERKDFVKLGISDLYEGKKDDDKNKSEDKSETTSDKTSKMNTDTKQKKDEKE